MASTTLLNEITRSTEYPVYVSVSGTNNGGYISISIQDWDAKMFYELPAIRFDVYTKIDNDYVKIKSGCTLDTYNPSLIISEDTMTSCKMISGIPDSCYIGVNPVFDTQSIEARNLLIKEGIEEGDLWEGKTTTFPITAEYTPSENSGGGGGGSSITVESLSVIENGTYTAPSGKAYSPVVVEIPTKPSLTGNISISNPYYNFNTDSLYLEYNRGYESGASNYGIWADMICNYTSPWEWCITYIPKINNTSSNVVLLGTSGPYYAESGSYSGDYYFNPTLEVWNGNEMFYGITEKVNEWQYASSISLSETLEINKSYSFVIGMNSDGIYVKAIRRDTNTIIGQITNSSTPQQITFNERYPGFLNNNKDNKFKLAGDIDLSKTYYKENGVLLWGCDT